MNLWRCNSTAAISEYCRLPHAAPRRLACSGIRLRQEQPRRSARGLATVELRRRSAAMTVPGGLPSGAANGGSLYDHIRIALAEPSGLLGFRRNQGTLVRPTAVSNASVALTGAFADGDVLAYRCVGFQ